MGSDEDQIGLFDEFTKKNKDLKLLGVQMLEMYVQQFPKRVVPLLDQLICAYIEKREVIAALLLNKLDVTNINMETGEVTRKVIEPDAKKESCN